MAALVPEILGTLGFPFQRKLAPSPWFYHFDV